MSSASRRDNLGLVIVYLAIFGLKKKKKGLAYVSRLECIFFLFLFICNEVWNGETRSGEESGEKEVRACACVYMCASVRANRET